MVSFYPGKRIPIKSILLSLANVKQIYSRLAAEVTEQADREISELVQPEDKSEEDWGTYIDGVREGAFKVTVTVVGADGSSIFGEDETVFDSPNMPNEVVSIYMTNNTAYQMVTGIKPASNFDLNLDFSKPRLLDEDNVVSSPTENSSVLSVSGQKDAWVATIVEAVDGILRDRRTNRTAIHRAFAYDLGLILIGIPAAFYVCWKSSGVIEARLGSINAFLSAVAYIYVGFAVVWIYRIMFGYTRWAFPSVELEERQSSAKKHRGFWYLIIIILVGIGIDRLL